MKYYMGHTQYGWSRHLVDVNVVESAIPKPSPNTDPISAVLYDKCIPKISVPAICGVHVNNPSINIVTKRLICFDYHWMTETTCQNCLRKFYDARDS